MNSIYDLHPDVFMLRRKDAQMLLKEVPINDFDICNWDREFCEEPAEILGMFENRSGGATLKFLCNRHKKMGGW